MSASHKGIIAVKFPGKLFPEEVVHKLSVPEMTCMGVIIPTEVEGKKTLLLERALLTEQHLDLTATQKAFEKQCVVLFTGQFPTPINEDDVQPFGLFKNSTGQDAVACVLNGEFTGFGEEKSVHSPEFFFAYKYLTPKLQKIFTDCGHDVAKFTNALDADPILKAEINAVAGKDHTILLVSENGIHKSFVNDPKQKSFDWGWMSDTLGYEVKTSAPIITSAAKAVGGFFKSAKTEKPAEPAAAPIPEPQKTDTKIPETVPEGMVYMSPPSWLTSNMDVRDWYDRKGIRPKNWKDRPAVLIKLDLLSEKEKSELKKQGKTEIIGKNAITGSNITVTSEHRTASGERFVPQSQINDMHAEFVQKTTFVDDPKNAEKEERDRQHFIDFKLGPLEALGGWSKEKIHTFISNYPQAATETFLDILWKAGIKKPASAQQQEAPPTEPEKKVEQQPPQPVKTGFFKTKAA